ncbi:TPA: pathogenicity island protein, partial [Staphylococcus pseudintermedius]|nr:pathogenicity island protein [Staphylococcus pseudintermedius]
SLLTKKMVKLLQKCHHRELLIIKKEYPNLSDDKIASVLGDYREYTELIKAIDIFIDFPINYAGSDVSKFLTEDDVEDLKLAIEEMTHFVEGLEEN